MATSYCARAFSLQIEAVWWVLSSHTQLSFTHSLSISLKLCSRVFIGFLLDFDFKKPLSLISLLQEKKEQHAGKNVHFGFTNVTRFELYVFLSNHEGHKAEGFWCTQEDDGWKFIPFSGWLELAHSRNYADPKYDGL